MEGWLVFTALGAEEQRERIALALKKFHWAHRQNSSRSRWISLMRKPPSRWTECNLRKLPGGGWRGAANTLATGCEESTRWKRPWCQERLKAGGEGTTEDEMGGWHHRLSGHEFQQALGAGDGQRGLACWSPWGRKEWDTTERLNWTELSWMMI